MSNLVLKPKVSEKAIAMAENNNVYVFDVPGNTTKIEIKKAVSTHFKVQVEFVKTIIVKGKVKRFKKILGRTKDIKKAYVKLKKGDSIKIFEGAK